MFNFVYNLINSWLNKSLFCKLSLNITLRWGIFCSHKKISGAKKSNFMLINENLLLEQILVTYVKITINPLAITKNIVNGNQEDKLIVRVIEQIIIVWIKINIPIDNGVLIRGIIADKITIIIIKVWRISVNSLS